MREETSDGRRSISTHKLRATQRFAAPQAMVAVFVEKIDFINQPAEVDTAPLLARTPRRLTPLAKGLATYLGPTPRALEHVPAVAA